MRTFVFDFCDGVQMNVRWIFALQLMIVTEMTSARHVIKRSDDPYPLVDVVVSHTHALDLLFARLQALENAAGRRAAFQAPLAKAVPANAPIPFDNGFTIGGGYDPLTGVYTVPLPGVYAFHYQLFPGDLTSFVMDLYTNGHLSRRSRCYDSSQYTTSCYASNVMHVKTGDKVWVQSDYAGAYYNGVHSFLQGVLLSPDPPESRQM